MKSQIHIDEILGSSKTRYFGNGYKHVSHVLRNISVEPNNNQISAEISIGYPADWSKKETSKELKPHLSTIDAYVISCQMVEAFTVHSQLLNAEERKQSWVRKLAIKAGKSPVNDLNNVSFKGVYEGTYPEINSLNKHISSFHLQLAGFTIDLELDHGPTNGVVNLEKCNFDSIEEILPSKSMSYYGGQYKNLHHDIVINEANAQLLRSEIAIEKGEDYQANTNLSAEHSSYYNPLDILISCAQLCQVLMYEIDNLDRTNTKNLWMRSINVYCPKPIIKEGNLPMTIRVEKSKLLEKGNAEWRFAELSADTSLDSACFLEASVAHEVATITAPEPA